MTTKQVDNEALKLKPDACAELAQKPLRSLEELSHEDIERIWGEEALHRDAELDSGTALMRDAEDVLKMQEPGSREQPRHDGPSPPLISLLFF